MRLVIWDAISPIMTSPQWINLSKFTQHLLRNPGEDGELGLVSNYKSWQSTTVRIFQYSEHVLPAFQISDNSNIFQQQSVQADNKENISFTSANNGVPSLFTWIYHKEPVMPEVYSYHDVIMILVPWDAPILHNMLWSIGCTEYICGQARSPYIKKYIYIYNYH